MAEKKVTAAKSAAKKTTAKAAPAKKAAPTKATAKVAKAPAKATATAKTSTAKTTATKATAAKAPAKKVAATKATAAKAPAKKAPATKAAATKAQAAAKKAPATKAAAAPASAPTKAPAKKAAAPAPTWPKVGPYASDSKFLQAQVALLNEERILHLGQATDLRAEADSLALEREPGDVQFDEESGEGGTVAVDRERNLALSAQAQAAVEEIDDALRKIGRKSYGTCERCFEPIPKARLEALPWARLCVACKNGGLSRR